MPDTYLGINGSEMSRIDPLSALEQCIVYGGMLKQKRNAVRSFPDSAHFISSTFCDLTHYTFVGGLPQPGCKLPEGKGLSTLPIAGTPRLEHALAPSVKSVLKEKN